MQAAGSQCVRKTKKSYRIQIPKTRQDGNRDQLDTACDEASPPEFFRRLASSCGPRVFVIFSCAGPATNNAVVDTQTQNRTDERTGGVIKQT